MPREQDRGYDYDEKVDIWAAGITLVLLLTGSKDCLMVGDINREALKAHNLPEDQM